MLFWVVVVEEDLSKKEGGRLSSMFSAEADKAVDLSFLPLCTHLHLGIESSDPTFSEVETGLKVHLVDPYGER